MEAKIIKTEEECNKALKRLKEIFDAPENTAEGDEAELLTVLVENYEDENFPIEASDSLENV